jgi:hypothetical protein
MCGNGLIGMAHAQLRATAGTPDGAVREHPGSAIEATAEIQDLAPSIRAGQVAIFGRGGAGWLP